MSNGTIDLRITPLWSLVTVTLNICSYCKIHYFQLITVIVDTTSCRSCPCVVSCTRMYRVFLIVCLATHDKWTLFCFEIIIRHAICIWYGRHRCDILNDQRNGKELWSDWYVHPVELLPVTMIGSCLLRWKTWLDAPFERSITDHMSFRFLVVGCCLFAKGREKCIALAVKMMQLSYNLAWEVIRYWDTGMHLNNWTRVWVRQFIIVLLLCRLLCIDVYWFRRVLSGCFLFHGIRFTCNNDARC